MAVVVAAGVALTLILIRSLTRMTAAVAVVAGVAVAAAVAVVVANDESIAFRFDSIVPIATPFRRSFNEVAGGAAAGGEAGLCSLQYSFINLFIEVARPESFASLFLFKSNIAFSILAGFFSGSKDSCDQLS